MSQDLQHRQLLRQDTAHVVGVSICDQTSLLAVTLQAVGVQVFDTENQVQLSLPILYALSLRSAV